MSMNIARIRDDVDKMWLVMMLVEVEVEVLLTRSGSGSSFIPPSTDASRSIRDMRSGCRQQKLSVKVAPQVYRGATQ